MILAKGLGAWEATTAAFEERQNPMYADVWTEWDEATNAWNVYARLESGSIS